MPTIPVRQLADKGILRDPSPYELDLNAWSGGSNMRFHANKAERAPIWRTVFDGDPVNDPFAGVNLFQSAVSLPANTDTQLTKTSPERAYLGILNVGSNPASLAFDTAATAGSGWPITVGGGLLFDRGSVATNALHASSALGTTLVVVEGIATNTFPTTPVFCVGREPSTGYDTVDTVGSDGRIWRYSSGISTEVSARGVSATMVVQGTGYSAGSPPTVTFSDPTVLGGRTATGTAVVNGSGAVTAITMTDPGFYPIGSATPTVAIEAPVSGPQATATVAIEWDPDVDPRSTTATWLGDVGYINRPSTAPQYFGPESVQYAPLPNMETQWTCRSLRAFNDYLIALNVVKPPSFVDPYTGLTQVGGNFPNLFKWSDLTFDGQVPPSWDPDNPTTNAGENPLEDATTPLVDGLAMHGVFIVYTENAVFAATPVDTAEIFTFQQLFSDGGMIAPNCGVEVHGIHYVFGPKDIYKHDGTSRVSIVDKRNKNFIYRNLNKQLSEVCFVAYMEQYDSILFAYNTGDSSAAFPGVSTKDPTGCALCNQGAIYDIPNDTWSFIDLPNVGAITQANLDMVLTWATASNTKTWATIGGSCYDQDNTYVKNVVGCSASTGDLFSSSKLIAYDFMNKGSLAYPYDDELNAPAVLERTGIDLDQVGSDLTTYKKIRRVFPLVSIFDNVPVSIQLGSSLTPSGTVTWGPEVTFDPTTDYKVDWIKGGRYLALRFTVDLPADFEVAGYDLDVTSGGRR